MPGPVAPRLPGAGAGIVLMEDLGPGASLAGSLLTGDRPRVRADRVCYAGALGSVHAWSMGRPGDPRLGTSPWPGAVARRKDAFPGAAVALGLAAAAAGTEIGQLCVLLNETGYHGLVHGDPARTTCGSAMAAADLRFRACRPGAVVLDASCLLAPFPSCWRSGRLPASLAAPALPACRGRLWAAGTGLGPSRDVALTAAPAPGSSPGGHDRQGAGGRPRVGHDHDAAPGC
jgi:hypothetical protein